MCGICGIVNLDSERPVERQALYRMNESISHRGPDGAGIHIIGPVGLAHRRLAIIDLDSGQQPLCNEDATVWVTFNGEIYNFRELRSWLEERGHYFKTRSDTEVLVHLYEECGPRFTERLAGMFAFALYDSRNQVFILARDRVGIKPLYYAISNGRLLFGSEMKSILTLPDFHSDINAGAIDIFLKFHYLPGEDTLLVGVKKLLPGHSLVVTGGVVSINPYWDLDFSEKCSLGFEDSVECLRDLLGQVVRDHLVSDVPLGVLLSGGVDSTAILAFAARASSERISTFTVGFSDPSVTDERGFARLAARHFGTDHHEISVGSDAFRDFLPAYVWHMEDPVCEPAAIALFYVSQLAARHVKVVLSGEGGDEAFAGYSSYQNHLMLERVKRTLGGSRRLVAVGADLCDRIEPLRKYRPYFRSLPLPLKHHYHSRTSNPWTTFNRMHSAIYQAEFLERIAKSRYIDPLEELWRNFRGNPGLEQMLYIDTKTWLPDDLLIKADKMTMANSLELRVPLLDHRILEFAARLPEDFKVRGSNGKRIFKASVSSMVPDEITKRKKVGFPVPYGRWFRSDLKGYLQEILLDDSTCARGYFRREAVEAMINGSIPYSDCAKDLFNLTVLELWHRAFVDRPLASLV